MVPYNSIRDGIPLAFFFSYGKQEVVRVSF
jgi:hypothetical protein